jgi:alpha-galactosidase
MNRSLTEVGSALLGPERQDETAHRYMLGVYAFMERLLSEFPAILFEGCSGGGGRYDPGMLYYMPQIWCSDNSDAIARVRIQYGTSLVYPPCTMAGHVTAVPNHQMGRTTSLRTRAHVALSGQFGFELDLERTTDAERVDVAEYTALAKCIRHLLRTADHYRLEDPFVESFAAWMLVAPGAEEALVTAILLLAEPIWRPRRLKLRGLDPQARYRSCTGPTGEWPGDFLMAVGLPVDLTQDFASELWHLQRIPMEAGG